MLVFPSVSADGYSWFEFYPSFDTYITSTGVWYNSSTELDSNDDYTHNPDTVMIVEWDITAIADTADNIEEMILIWNVSNVTAEPAWCQVAIWSIANRPSTTNNGVTMYNDAISGERYMQAGLYWDEYGNESKSFTSKTSLFADFIAHLSSNWFALSYVAHDAWTGEPHCNGSILSSEGDAIGGPKLLVKINTKPTPDITITLVSPLNNSINASGSPDTFVTVNHEYGDTLDIDWYRSSDGLNFYKFRTLTNRNNGTYYAVMHNLTTCSDWEYWYVVATDPGGNYTTSDLWRFKTECSWTFVIGIAIVGIMGIFLYLIGGPLFGTFLVMMLLFFLSVPGSPVKFFDDAVAVIVALIMIVVLIMELRS